MPKVRKTQWLEDVEPDTDDSPNTAPEWYGDDPSEDEIALDSATAEPLLGVLLRDVLSRGVG